MLIEQNRADLRVRQKSKKGNFITPTDRKSVSRLAGALSVGLPSRDAKKMAILIDAALFTKEISIENIPFSDDDLRDYLVMAFEERILIPARTRRPGCDSWDRVLRFAPKEMFFMPQVARTLFEIARICGAIDAAAAVRNIMSLHPSEYTDEAICFLKMIRHHFRSCIADENTIISAAKDSGLTIDLYDLIDHCIIAGIINPCSQGASVQSCWYEFHPCLYWDGRFK